MSSGVEWQEQRRFALRQLREFGFGKSSMEELFQEEIRKLCSLYRLKTDGGRAPIDLHLTVNVSIINSLWQVLTGETFQDLEDPKLKKIAGLIDAMLSGERRRICCFLGLKISGRMLRNELPSLR